jgi:thiol:disulfide interchange protein DsbD
MFDSLSDLVAQRGLWVALPFVFVGGFLLNLTPCVFPMIPVTLSFFSSQAADAGSGRRTVWLALCYVLGLAFSYAVLGLLAARTGALFGAWLQQPAVLVVMAAVLAGLALGMFGVYELRVPQAVARRVGSASAGLWGACTMGALVGVVAAPCVGPFLAGLLLLVSRLQQPAAGFLLFLVLGLGMGAPYLALGVATDRVRRLPKAGPWLVWVKQALGVVLLGVALFFLNPLLPPPVTVLLTAALLAGGGVFLGWLAPSAGQRRGFVRVRQAVGAVLLASAALLVVPRPADGPRVVWVPYSEAALERAQREQRPILIDVYADWCLPCVEMDHTTFRNPEVARALADVATLRLDVTRGVPEEGERLLERYRVFGAPTVLFFDRTGRERSELRLTGFVRPDEFLNRLRRIQ